MDRDRRYKDTTSDLPKIYEIFLCEVGSIQQYGTFVKIPGFNKNGLVHKSQMSKTRIDDPSEMVSLGDRVYCKVISIDKESEKIGMSMKVVNQTTGQDMDPGNVQTSLDEQRRKTGHIKDRPPIKLGAVLDTTCKKCGGHGHLTQDCFHQPGAKSYDLLPDEDFMMEQEKHTEHGKKKSKKNKKEKKAKKKRKIKKAKKEAKKRKQKESNSDYDSSENDHKHSQKRKRKRYQTSSSDDSETSHSDEYSPPKRRKSSEDAKRDHFHNDQSSSNRCTDWNIRDRSLDTSREKKIDIDTHRNLHRDRRQCRVMESKREDRDRSRVHNRGRNSRDSDTRSREDSSPNYWKQ